MERKMKIVIASDSFKGSLSAKDVCLEIEKAAKIVFQECDILKIPIADGGEGTLESIIEAVGGKYKTLVVNNPLGKPTAARYGILDNSTVIIEMAQASGLPLLTEEERDIMIANSFGTGELILDALESGYKTIYIGLGGSATNDGGIGCAAALGAKFIDVDGNELLPIPKNLKQIAKIDVSELNPKIKDTTFIILSDVKNPLTGELGATNVFGKQKGATENDQLILEEGMIHYESILGKTFMESVGKEPGAGAAGGLGAGLIAFTNAKIVSGIEQILKIVHFEEHISDANFVITGEGRMDSQSAYGKVVSGIGRCCKEKQIPCVAIVGSIGTGAEELYNFGIDSIMTTINSIMPLQAAMKDAKNLCFQAAERMLRFIKVGMDIGE